MKNKNKKAEELIYNMFLRKQKPSVFRLAGLQLIREGIDLSNDENFCKNWNLLLDRARQIILSVNAPSPATTKNRVSAVKQLHTELMNLSEDCDE